jgi:hypothetical protein
LVPTNFQGSTGFCFEVLKAGIDGSLQQELLRAPVLIRRRCRRWRRRRPRRLEDVTLLLLLLLLLLLRLRIVIDLTL